MDYSKIVNFEPNKLGVSILIAELEAAERMADDEVRIAWDDLNIAGGYHMAARYVADSADTAVKFSPSSDNTATTEDLEVNAIDMRKEFNKAEKVYDYWYQIREITSLWIKYWKAEGGEHKKYQQEILGHLTEIWDSAERTTDDDKTD